MSQQCDRFSQLVSDEELASVIQKSKPENTKRQEIWAINIWTEWNSHRQNTTNATISSKYLLPPKSLSDFESDDEREYWVSKFVLEVKNSEGSEYTPTTLKYILVEGLLIMVYV